MSLMVSRMNLLVIRFGRGRDLAGDDRHAGLEQRLAGDACMRVFGQDGVEDGIRHLVGHLVRVAFGTDSDVKMKLRAIAFNSRGS